MPLTFSFSSTLWSVELNLYILIALILFLDEIADVQKIRAFLFNFRLDFVK